MTKGTGDVCHLCGGATELIDRAEDLRCVTSDARPWGGTAAFLACTICGTVQKRADAAWRDAAGRLYAGYDIYGQSCGGEQRVFVGGGMPQARSLHVLERLGEAAGIGAAGRLLDIGCGNGGLLRSMAGLRPGWALYGTELSERHRKEIEAIPGVAGFFSGPLDRLPWHDFDLLTLFHVLEHITEPIAFLQQASGLLAPEGRLLIECPNLVENPFDLMIFDHCTHFSPESLQTLCHRAGLRTVIARTDWVPRETSALVASGATATPPHVDAASADLATQHLAWLRALAGGFRRLVAQPSPVGIFGSSIGATWLQHQNENGARFFVDEDSTRIGRRHCGTPIIGSDEVPADAIVVVALPEPLAQSIAQRLARSGVRYLTPAAVAAF